MKQLYIGFLLVLVAGAAFGQFESKTLAKANKYYENFSYEEAIDKYEQSQDNSVNTQRNLAISYMRLGDSQKAEEILAALVNNEQSGLNAEDIYMYAAILQQNKKYEASEKWMKVFNTMEPGDSRGLAYVKQTGYYNQLLQDKGQFSIKNLAINSEAGDFGPVYYQDKILFASSREGIKPIRRKWNWNNKPFLDIYEAKRAEENELDAVSLFNKKLNKRFHEGPVCFNADETMMVATTNNYGGKDDTGNLKLKLVISYREKNKWSKPKEFPYNSIEYSVGHASLSKDGQWMYFASDMPGGIGGVDIYKVKILEDGSFGEPINLGDKVNTEGNEMFPFIHQNNLLFFASDGKVGLGGLDVFVAQISDAGLVGEIQNFGVPINSHKDDFSFVLDDTMTSGYFASNRDDGKGDDDIYSFKLHKPILFGIKLIGTAYDTEGNILAGVVVNLTESNETREVVTGKDGTYEFIIEKDKNYDLAGAKEKYFEGRNTADSHTTEPIVRADLILERDPGLSLYVLVTDKITKEPLDSVKMVLLDNMTNKADTLYTSATGDYRKPLVDKKLNDRGSYNFELSKPGYLSKVVTYNTEFDHEGQYDVYKALDFTMDKIQVGEDLSSIIDINPIYFDLNKSNIRPDAAIELDKIVKVMNENPEMEIELGSHTDSRGSAAYNMALSDRRAKSSAAYIKSKISNPDRIYGKGYGETQLLNKCADGVKCSEKEHQLNRRTEFKIIKLKK